jgi:hypothetical protein
MRLDTEQYASVVVGVIKSALKPIQERLAALESRTVTDGKDGSPGAPGRDGKDADESLIRVLESDLAAVRYELAEIKAARPEPVDLPALVKAAVSAEVALIPAPKDGEPGRSVELADVEQLVKAAMDAIQRPQDGRSVTVDDVAPLVVAEVAKAVSALPVPPEPVSVADALIARDGQLTVTFTDGTVKSVGVVVGKDADPEDIRRLVVEAVAEIPRPKDGVDGRDGIGFDDFDERLEEDGRTVTRTYRAGARVKEIRHTLPAILYRGLYDPATAYEKGDAVTWGGSMWIAKETTTSVAPDENSPAGKKAWALSVMRGRQGKQGLKGDDGKPGPRGEMGPQGQRGY